MMLQSPAINGGEPFVRWLSLVSLLAWQTWHNAGMLAGGAVLGDNRWVAKAIGDPQNGFVFQMHASVSAEGMWYQNSWGYHFYTLGALVRIVEGARRLGIDLRSHPALRKMFTLPIEYALPDGSPSCRPSDAHGSRQGDRRVRRQGGPVKVAGLSQR